LKLILSEGTEFYISIDGVETVFNRYDLIDMTVPLSTKSIEWGFRGEQVISADDIHFFIDRYHIIPPTYPPTSLSITGYMRPWRGFLFW
jgi:hypothetical protein